MPKSAVKYIVGGVMFVVGLTMVILAAVIGGVNIIRDGFPVVRIGSYGLSYKTESCEASVPASDITRLRVYAGSVIVDIRTDGSGSDIEIQCDNVPEKTFRYENNNGLLDIECGKSGFSLFDFGSGSAKMTIIIPSGMTFNDVEISVGAGDCVINGISANETFLVNGGAGSIKISGISAGRIDINSGIGEVRIDNGISQKLEIDSGVGAVIFSGVVEGDIDIDSGIGQVRIDLAGDPGNYRFDVDGGLGKVSLNGGTLVSGGTGRYLIDIDSGIGEVAINIHP